MPTFETNLAAYLIRRQPGLEQPGNRLQLSTLAVRGQVRPACLHAGAAQALHALKPLQEGGVLLVRPCTHNM
jgi:hypothetical protein